MLGLSSYFGDQNPHLHVATGVLAFTYIPVLRHGRRVAGGNGYPFPGVLVHGQDEMVETARGLAPGDGTGHDLARDSLVGARASVKSALPALSDSRGGDSDLIDGVRAGDPSAMALLYERHQDQALKFARSLVPQPQDAEDVLHEAFAKTVSAIRNGYGPDQNFGAYLSTCVRSVAVSVRRRQASEKPVTFEELERGPVKDPGLETVLSVSEHDCVTAAMRTLPERWRTVLWHAEVMGDPPRDIAPLMGIEPNAVSALLIRARKGLRAAFELQSAATANATGDKVLN